VKLNLSINAGSSGSRIPVDCVTESICQEAQRKIHASFGHSGNNASSLS